MDAAIAFIIITLASAIGWHYSVKSYTKAVVGTTLTVILLFQISVIFSVGYFDPFFTAALAVLGVLAAIISIIIGIPFQLWKKNKPH
ncbi:MAG: hypothetical protein R3182_13630 [Draconibacterium sp.]|nr:hypothetical protein [Draconibacterium sp.]